eukprot:scaffold32171_cov45-Cyclotella_meneghiniana.AAC.1
MDMLPRFCRIGMIRRRCGRVVRIRRLSCSLGWHRCRRTTRNCRLAMNAVPGLVAVVLDKCSRGELATVLHLVAKRACLRFEARRHCRLLLLLLLLLGSE